MWQKISSQVDKTKLDKQKIEANSKHLEPISDRGYELIHEPKTRDNSNKRKNQLKQQQNPSSSSYK